MRSPLGQLGRAAALAVAIPLALVGASGAGPLAADEPAPVMWHDPGDVATKDLFWGGGAADRVPQPPFTFVKEDLDGTKPKVHVLDARGTAWSVKFDRRRDRRGLEVPTEIAASRLVWALGYFVEESYLVTDGVIERVGRLQRAQSVLGSDGRFTRARFERRSGDVERLEKQWGVDDNPFVGTKELSGLLLVTALLNNWDFRPDNTGVLRVRAAGRHHDRYLVTDLGTAFGRMPGSRDGHRSKWNVKDYQADPAFTVRPDADILELNLRQDDGSPVRVPTAHARWLVQWTSKLTEPQVRRAFEAAGASHAEATGFTEAFLQRVRALEKAVAGS
jgi:hypothetical protein